MLTPVKFNVPEFVLVSAPVVVVPVAPANVNVALLSIVAVVPAVIVNALSDVSPAPVYIKVPLPNTKLVLALVAALKLLEVLPPIPIVPTLNVPALRVTIQVCKFVQVNIPAELELKRDITFKVFSDYLLNHSLPKWEVPNTIAKYFITTTALEMAKAKD